MGIILIIEVIPMALFPKKFKTYKVNNKQKQQGSEADENPFHTEFDQKSIFNGKD